MRCPACNLARLTHTADLGAVPALCGVTWDSSAAARSSPRGEMRLAHCPVCAHVVNVAFQPELSGPASAHENSLHYSATFAGYATQLAKRLAARYELAGRTVLEPGCGNGDFLIELCEVGDATGIGYDAGYVGPERVGRAWFVRGYLGSGVVGPQPRFPADFIVNRHVLEHLEDPYGLLVELRRLAGRREVYGYFEVPNAGYDLATAGWDCVYPHVSYFNADSLTRMVRRAGFDVLAVGTGLDDVVLWVEVAANPTGRTVEAASRADVAARQLARLAGFGQRHADAVAQWRTALTRWTGDGAQAVLWGAGARGVSFVNAVDPGQWLAGVIDVNSRKWGRHLPVTGHRVFAPAEVVRIEPEYVVVTNPAYRREVEESLVGLGVKADVLVA